MLAVWKSGNPFGFYRRISGSFFSDWDLNFCQAVPLRDRALFSKYFLSVLEFATKVLLTVWKSINPFGCYRRIFGFVLRAVDFACELKFFTHKKSILKVVSLIALAISFPLMPAKSLCDENRGRYQRFYNRKWYGNLSIASFKSDLTHLNE